MTDRRIAIVGMSFRFPGAGDEGAFWRNIRDGVCSVRRFTDADFAAAGLPPARYRDPDFVGASGVFGGIADFDAGFFGMSGTTARATDPQQRLFLEICYHAMEDAGYAAVPEDTRVGVFAGTGYHLYGMHSYLISNLIPEGWPDWVAGTLVTNGNHPDFLATRVAFELGLTGPALGVQCACSTALAGVHLAAQALLTGDADLAIAGAAAVHVPQVLGYRHVKGSILSRTGVCRAFDADCDGTVGGNGVAAVVLKRLDRALADGDTVHAVLLGSGISNDGAAKAGYSAPSVSGQRSAIRRALESAGVGADGIGYLEAHGTGTYKGDPIEFEALTSAFREDSDRLGYCAIGSTKPNIGHLDACAGMASLIKTVLVLKNATIPPLANFRTPNPLLSLDASPFRIPVEAQPWPAGDGPRRAGVNGLGVGGTNVHLILEQAPPRTPPHASLPALPLTPVPLSAKTASALSELCRSYVDRLRADRGLDLGDLAVSAGAGRRHFAHRAVALGRDLDEVASNLAEAGLPRGTAPANDADVAMVFSGQGGAYPGMARVLHDLFPVVRDTLAACEEHHRVLTGTSLMPALLGTGSGPADGEVWPTELAQPALFAFQVSQWRLWRSVGVRPRIVAGHSVGEYAALHAAGALSLADGMRLTVARGRLMRDGASRGAMISVFVDGARIDALRRSVPGLDLAAVNGEEHHVLAGEDAAVRALRELLDSRGTRHVMLPVDRAFHSRQLDALLGDWRAVAAETAWQDLEIPFADGPEGLLHAPGWRPDADYLVRQTREPVRFDRILAALAGAAAIVEIGPGAVLTGLVRQALPGAAALPSQRRGREAETFAESVGRLYCAGAEIDWSALTAGRGGGRVPLPRYPFQRRTYWSGPPPVPLDIADPEPEPQSERNSMTVAADQTRYEQQVLGRITDLTVRHFGCEPAEVTPDTPFVEFGADSLQMINMVRELEREYAVKLGLREVFEQAGTPWLLAGLVAGRSAGTGPAREHPAAPAPESAWPETAPPPVSAPDPAPAPAPAPAAPTLESLAEQIRVMQDIQLQLMAQLSQLLTRQLAGSRHDH